MCNMHKCTCVHAMFERSRQEEVEGEEWWEEGGQIGKSQACCGRTMKTNDRREQNSHKVRSPPASQTIDQNRRYQGIQNYIAQDMVHNSRLAFWPEGKLELWTMFWAI